jgi:hypothetical protein
MNGRLSRADRRTLQRDDAPYLSRPLQLSGDPRSMAANVRHVVHILRSPTAKSPSAEAMAHIAAVHDRTVPKAVEKMVACKKGCFHCCSQMVVISATEAFAVAAEVRRRTGMPAAVTRVAQETGALTLEERLGRDIFCPLLSDAACSIYSARPLGCRGFVSTSLEACLAAFTRGEAPNIPSPIDATSVLYACRIMLIAAQRLLGLDDATYEMNTAVAAALAGEDTESRWLAGQRIFAGVSASPPPPPQFETAIRQLVAYVAPTV